ncbi:hypothetical protein BC835DRAFT_1309000 [Cytidiella melzeri]|nr:hypothetical protein BC835DRAFT_1309000 [Cytidiella melzeri]
MDSTETWEEYLTRARELLTRPNTIAYLMKGGIMSRIEMWLGSPDLVGQFAQSPSSEAVLKPTKLEPEKHCLQDHVSAEDLRTLYGTVRDPDTGTVRTWFPTQETCEHSGFFRGEWTNLHKQWFQNQLEGPRTRSNQWKPLTPQLWLVKLKRRASRIYDENYPSRSAWLELKDGFANLLGGPWDCAGVHALSRGFDYKKLAP